MDYTSWPWESFCKVSFLSLPRSLFQSPALPVTCYSPLTTNVVALMTVFSGFFIEFVVRYVKSSPARRQVDLLKPFNRLRAPFTKRRSTTKSTRSKTAMVETKGPQPLSTPDSETTVDVEANRFARSAPETEISDKRVRWMMASLTSSTLLLFVRYVLLSSERSKTDVTRGVYRCDELLDFTGLNSGAYANQNLFIGMDATLMVSRAAHFCSKLIFR